ncbi:MAG: DUF1080 domain-containing protein [Planctomycetaceae bacterium]
MIHPASAPARLRPKGLLLPAALCMAAVVAVAGRADEPAWRPLFNGKDLAGWTPKIRGQALGDNYGDTFRVEDGLLKVVYDPAKYPTFGEKFGHLFFDEPFSRYRLRIEYRFVGEQCPGGPGWAIRNSGVMLHGEDPKGMTLDQDFPASIEVQFLGGAAEGERTTANLCTPGTNVVYRGTLHTPHCTNSSSKTYRGADWVTVEIEVDGDRVIRHTIDGTAVLEYEQAQLDPADAHAAKLAEARGGRLLLDGGTISLQSESHPIEFRRVDIQELPPRK